MDLSKVVLIVGSVVVLVWGLKYIFLLLKIFVLNLQMLELMMFIFFEKGKKHNYAFGEYIKVASIELSLLVFIHLLPSANIIYWLKTGTSGVEKMCETLAVSFDINTYVSVEILTIIFEVFIYVILYKIASNVHEKCLNYIQTKGKKTRYPYLVEKFKKNERRENA